MKKFLKNLLMKHLIDSVTSKGFRKKIPFAKFNKYYFVSKNTKKYFSGQFRLKTINKS